MNRRGLIAGEQPVTSTRTGPSIAIANGFQSLNPPQATPSPSAQTQAFSYQNPASWMQAFKAPVTGDTVYGGTNPTTGQFQYVGPNGNIFTGSQKQFYFSTYNNGKYESAAPGQATFLNPTDVNTLTSGNENQAQAADFNKVPVGGVHVGDIFTELGSGTRQTVGANAVLNGVSAQQTIFNGGQGSLGNPQPITTPNGTPSTDNPTVPPVAGNPNSASNASAAVPSTSPTASNTDATALAQALSGLAGGGGGGASGIGTSIPSPVVIPPSPTGDSNGGLGIAVVAAIIAGGVWYFVEHRKKHHDAKSQ